MEFFSSVELPVSAGELQQQLTIAGLPEFCASVNSVLEQINNSGRIYCVWGEFAVNRELINGGVRFSLPACPNNLAWTVTTDLAPRPDEIQIHLTISRQQIDSDFLESIELFMADCKKGITHYFSTI